MHRSRCCGVRCWRRERMPRLVPLRDPRRERRWRSNGSVTGKTPYQTNLPGGYFHKTHTAFNARLEHALVARVSKDGYSGAAADTHRRAIRVGGGDRAAARKLLSAEVGALQRQAAGAWRYENCRWMRRVKRGRCERRRANRRMVRRSKPRRGVGRLRSVPTWPVLDRSGDGEFVGQTPSTLSMGRELITSR